MKIVRVGSCCKCGECCGDCEFLLPSKLCKVYEHRPSWCVKDYPRASHFLFPGCTYSFVLEDDGNEDVLTIAPVS